MTAGETALVKAPQSRDGRGVSTVQIEPAANWRPGPGRVYVKRQNRYYCHPVWRLGLPTPVLRRELRGLHAARRARLNVPEVVHYAGHGGTATLVLREITDATALQDALTGGAQSDLIAERVGTAIGHLHRRGWTHGALYSDHILVRRFPEPVVYLIDFEKAHWSPLRRKRDMDRFWRSNAYLSGPQAEIITAAYQAALKPRGAAETAAD